MNGSDVAIISAVNNPSSHVDPSKYTLAQLAKIRGAMWTARGPLPWGPRPGKDDNCVCIDYFECFEPSAQAEIVGLYGPKSIRRYTHAPMGPIVDAGYHDQLPAVDWRSPAGFATYLDAAQKLEDAGVHVVHFIRPDRGCAGLEWTIEDLDRELAPYLTTARAQRLMRIVVIGWEPGPKYYYDNAWWRSMARWLARIFPKALRLIHMVCDCDAPVGGDDDKKGISNGQGWINVAPYLHGFLAQVCGYVGGGSPIATPQFCADWQGYIADMKARFQDRGVHGDWPKFSAFAEPALATIGRRDLWVALVDAIELPDDDPNRPGAMAAAIGAVLGALSDNVGLKMYAGEFAAYADYWLNYPESESIRLGDLALAAGADGALDGCTP